MSINKKAKPSLLRRIVVLEILIFIFITVWYMHRLTSVDIIFAKQSLNDSSLQIKKELEDSLGEIHYILKNSAKRIKLNPINIVNEMNVLRKFKGVIDIKDVSWVASQDKYMILSGIDHYLNRNIDFGMLRKSVDNPESLLIGRPIQGAEGVRAAFSINTDKGKYMGTILLLLDVSSIEKAIDNALHVKIHPEISYALLSYDKKIIIPPTNKESLVLLMHELNSLPLSYKDTIASKFPIFGIGYTYKKSTIKILDWDYYIISIVDNKIAFQNSIKRLKFLKFDLLVLCLICFYIFIFMRYRVVMPIHRLTLAANMKDYKGRNTYSYHYSTKELSDLSDGIRSLVSKQHYIMDYTNKLSFALKQIEVLRKERLEFFRNMQHMLRTPIGHIIGASDIIMTQHKSEISDVTQDYISMINNAATELLSSVNTMFTSADIEAGNIELNQMDCNVRKVVEDVIHDVSPRMKEAQLSLEVNIKKIPKVNIDPIWFGAAIFNIIDNSIKFSNSGGSIKIAIRRVNAGISLVIEDNGIGMSAHQIFNIQKVLENPLSKNNIAETNDGIGLGLTIAHHILELHNISLSIESTEGVGTKVTIIIPNIKIKKVAQNV